MKRNFENIIANLKKTIATYQYYVDFNKVYDHFYEYENELNILNSLIGSTTIEKDFLNIINKNPNVLSLIPLLLAVRKTEIPIIDNENIIYNFKNKIMSDEEYIKFMTKTNLFDLFKNNKITNLKDYVLGIEVGLDSNARKNRTGTIMENIVENFIKNIKIEYYKEITKKDIASKFNLNINDLITKENKSNKDPAEKRFDFAIKTKTCLYLLETNFYNTSGSKLNETARSFASLSKKINEIKNVSFIWITDGIGWKNTKNGLKEAYNEIEHLYTLYDLENNILKELII